MRLPRNTRSSKMRTHSFLSLTLVSLVLTLSINVLGFTLTLTDVTCGALTITIASDSDAQTLSDTAFGMLDVGGKIRQKFHSQSST